jgi:hypothetical protein
MNKVVELFGSYRNAPQYQETVAAAVAALQVSDVALRELATDAAFTGPWSKWSDEQPIGAEVFVSAEDLAGTDDEVVQALLSVTEAIRSAVERIARTGLSEVANAGVS